MLSVDLSKVVPERAFLYLAALFPGLFFEISVALGNPDLVAAELSKLQRLLALSRYETLAIGLFVAFVVGNAFMLLVCPLIQTLIGYCCVFQAFAWRKICKWPLLPLSRWLQKKPFWRRWPRMTHLLMYVQTKAAPVLPQELRDGYRCWQTLARKLLKTRYGVELDDLHREWRWLYWTLGAPTPEDMRGQTFVIATHAAGWAGLVAMLIAPVLRNKYYVIFCLLMVVVGLHHDYYVARRRTDPHIATLIRIRALLREYKNTPAAPRRQLRQDSGLDDEGT